MRILVFSEYFRPFVGGIEVLADQLLPALVKKGHEIQVVTSHGPIAVPDEESFGGVLVRRYPFRTVLEGKDPEGMLLLRGRMRQLLREIDPDVIHLNGLAGSHLLLLPALSGQRGAILLQLHQRLFEWEAAPDAMASRLMKRSDWVLSVCNSTLVQARQALPEIEPRSSVIRNTVAAPPFDPTPLPFMPPTFLCLGRLAAQKQFDLALRAAAPVLKRCPEVRMIFAGDGDEKPALQALASSLGIADRCEWLGWVRPADIGGVINRATAMILPSRWEGLPLVAVEAGWMGRPMVATRIDGVREIIRDGETGLLTEPDNVDDLTAALLRLLERPEDTRRMGAASRAWVQREFNWDDCVAAYDALYRRMGEIARARRGPS